MCPAKVFEINPSEVDRLSLTLQRDKPAVEHFTILLDGRVVAVYNRAADLRFGILHDRIAIDDMCDQGVAQYDQLSPYPLVAVVCFGSGVDAMPGIQFTLVHDMCAGRAHIARSAGFAIAQSTQELHFDGDGPVLFFGHGARVLGMVHDATVAQCIVGRTALQLTHETVLQLQVIIREGGFIIQVAKLVIEIAILVVVYPDHTILDAKGVPEVDAHFVVLDLYKPIVEVFTVEEGNPFTVSGSSCFRRSATGERNRYNKGDKKEWFHVTKDKEAKFKQKSLYGNGATGIKISINSGLAKIGYVCNDSSMPEIIQHDGPVSPMEIEHSKFADQLLRR